MDDALKKRLLACATTPYRRTGFFNHRWACGKLKHDPIFAAMLDHPVFPDNATVLDLGCGRGLLAAWMLGAERSAERGEWQGDAPPKNLHFRGVELMEREAICGNRALQPLYGPRVQLAGGDMRHADFTGVDAVAIFDVLHYIPYAEQDALLDRIGTALGSGGRLVTRIGDAGGGWRFTLSRWVDAGMTFVQGHRLPRMWCRPLPAWISALEGRGFAVRITPMSRGTPFANVMLAATRQ
jgi:SAM-dependent methyltransferase